MYLLYHLYFSACHNSSSLFLPQFFTSPLCKYLHTICICYFNLVSHFYFQYFHIWTQICWCICFCFFSLHFQYFCSFPWKSVNVFVFAFFYIKLILFNFKLNSSYYEKFLETRWFSKMWVWCVREHEKLIKFSSNLSPITFNDTPGLVFDWFSFCSYLPLNQKFCIIYLVIFNMFVFKYDLCVMCLFPF